MLIYTTHQVLYKVYVGIYEHISQGLFVYIFIVYKRNNRITRLHTCIFGKGIGIPRRIRMCTPHSVVYGYKCISQ